MNKTTLFTTKYNEEIPELSNIEIIDDIDNLYDYISTECEVIKFSLPVDVVKKLIADNKIYFHKFHFVTTFTPIGSDREEEAVRDFINPKLIMHGGERDKDDKVIVDTYWKFKSSNPVQLFPITMV